MAESDTVDTKAWTVNEGDSITKPLTPKVGGAVVSDLAVEDIITHAIYRWRGKDAPVLLVLDVAVAAGVVTVSHDYSPELDASNVGRTAWVIVKADHPSFKGTRTIFSGPFTVRAGQ